MKLKMIKLSLAMLTCLSAVLMTNPAFAAGLLTPKDAGIPALDIKDHKVNVVIEDGYAMTTIEQVFYNPHHQDMEAIYSFPVPDKAAVSEFTMWIDGQPITGEVLEKKKAREVYEDQKAKNNDTGITEKNQYKTFEITVYPVRAGKETKIRLSYYQPAHVDTGIGRYVYPLEDGGVDDAAIAFWTTNEKVSGTFSFDLQLRLAYPIHDIRLPMHPQAQISQNGDRWSVHLDNYLMSSPVLSTNNTALTLHHGLEEETSVSRVDPAVHLNTDIVLYYRFVENLPGSVDLVAYKEKGSKRGTFMLTITPGMDLQPIDEGRDWIFVLDISGSMQGKYATLAEGVSRALQTMEPKDRFRIVLFNSRVKELTNGFVTANPENVQQYIHLVTNVQPGEGTDLYAGLQLGLKSLNVDRTASIILVTDGVANVGETQQKRFIDLISQYDVRLFTFIMGNSANKPLLECLTRVSNGFALNVSDSDDIIGKIMLAKSKVNYQSLHGTKVQISGVKTADMNLKKIGNVYRGQQLVLFGHYFGNGPAEVTLTGKISGEEKLYATQFNFPEVAKENPEIERLWAYSMIETITQTMEDFGEDQDLKNSVVDLGVEYGLVTDYTSMVVVKDEVFQELGIERRNKNRLANEKQASEMRSSYSVVNHRIDQSTPMFNQNQPTFTNGAGALGPGSLLALSPLLWGLRRKKKINDAGINHVSKK